MRACCRAESKARNLASHDCIFPRDLHLLSRCPPHLKQGKESAFSINVWSRYRNIRFILTVLTLTVHEIHILATHGVPQFIGHHPQFHNQLPGSHVWTGYVHLHLRVVDLAHQTIACHIWQVPEHADQEAFTYITLTSALLFNFLKKRLLEHLVIALFNSMAVWIVMANQSPSLVQTETSRQPSSDGLP